jgi:hypothetical protein
MAKINSRHQAIHLLITNYAFEHEVVVYRVIWLHALFEESSEFSERIDNVANHTIGYCPPSVLRTLRLALLAHYSRDLCIQSFRAIVEDILTAADKFKVRSLAIPPIGTGNLGYSVSMVARTIVEGVTDYISKHPSGSLSEIRFVVLPTDDTAYEVIGYVFVIMS